MVVETGWILWREEFQTRGIIQKDHKAEKTALEVLDGSFLWPIDPRSVAKLISFLYILIYMIYLWLRHCTSWFQSNRIVSFSIRLVI